MCLRAENVFLPKNGHFGVSAATGGLADDHDVFHFLTTSLHIPGQISDSNKLPEADSAKLTQEYQDYQKKMDLQREEYQKEHPDEKKEEYEDWFESDNQRELRQIWQSQSQMTDVLRELARKMDEVVGRQERTLGLLSTNAAAAPVGSPIVAGTGELKRHEIDAIITTQNVLVQTLNAVKLSTSELQARTEAIIQNQARAPTAQIQGGGFGFDSQSIVTELRDSLNHVKQSVNLVHQKYAVIII